MHNKHVTHEGGGNIPSDAFYSSTPHPSEPAFSHLFLCQQKHIFISSFATKLDVLFIITICMHCNVETQALDTKKRKSTNAFRKAY